jgi:cyclopropane fatty-acyl-phospholipid synthase-like methyltransferase
MSPVQTGNINSHFFNGHYKDIWRTIIPEALTKAEVDFLINEATLNTSSNVLDLMCGYGRHALALARKGIHIVAVDNLPDYVNEIKQIVLKENLPVSVHQEDVIQFNSPDEYDLVICLGNNLSFFNYTDSLKLFSSIASWIKPGNKFVFNTWTIAEIAIKQFKENSWAQIGDLKCLYNSKYLFSPARIETESIFIASDGETEIKSAVDYIYSLNETEAILNRSGLIIKDIWSIPGKKKFSLGEPRAYIVAEKI